MPRMNNVEVAGDERDALIRAGWGADHLDYAVVLRGFNQVVQGTKLRLVFPARA